MFGGFPKSSWPIRIYKKYLSFVIIKGTLGQMTIALLLANKI